MNRSMTTLVTILTVGLLAGSIASVAAQDTEPEGPVGFTAEWVFGSPIRPDAPDRREGTTWYSGGAWRPGVWREATDPRLRGDLSVARNSVEYDDGPEVASVVFRIENEAGSWTTTPFISLTDPDRSPKSDVAIFVGDGAYEGLLAVTRIDTDSDRGKWELSGYIIGDDLPGAPEPVIGT